MQPKPTASERIREAREDRRRAILNKQAAYLQRAFDAALGDDDLVVDDDAYVELVEGGAWVTVRMWFADES